MDLALRQRNIKRSLTCPICQKLFRQVTTIEECCHRFCYKCIIKKINEEGLHNCPVCNVDLGCAPLQRLRIDNRWQSIMDNFNERKREHIERGLLKEKTKFSEVSRSQEMKGFDVVSSAPFPNQSKERAVYPLANTLIPEASSYAHTSIRINEKQKYNADGLKSKQYFQKSNMENEEKSLEKMREMWRPLIACDNANICMKSYPTEHVQGQGTKYLVPNIEDVGFTSPLQRSRELRARQREEENSIVVASGGLKNTTKVVADGNNVECNEKDSTFWFSLVASNNQKSKAPLEQIRSRYLRVKDGNITVSSIKKYLMQKLNLRSENEVEISLQGRLLLPNLQIWKLVDLWLHTTAASERKRAFAGSSAHDFVLTLTYARRPIST